MHEHIKNRIQSIITNIDQLPSIPETASRIMNMANDPDVSFKLIAEEISKDQAMTTNILKLCNSAYFSKGKEISSIERAIVTLGLKEVKNIVLVVAAKPLLDRFVIGYDLGKGELWKQSLLVATLSRNIALKMKRRDIADVVFTGGLIHNIGKIVLALFVQSTFKDLIHIVQERGITFNQAEKEIMGFCHQEIGEKILAKWNFPEVLQAIVRYYHEPGNAPSQYRVETSIVHVASNLSLMASVGVGSDGLYHEMSEQAIKDAGLSGPDLEELYSAVPETLKKVTEII